MRKPLDPDPRMNSSLLPRPIWIGVSSQGDPRSPWARCWAATFSGGHAGRRRLHRSGAQEHPDLHDGSGRKPQWFPKGWEEKYLPNTQRLKRDGLTFENAFVRPRCARRPGPRSSPACSRAAPVKDTLTLDMEQSPVEHQLDPTLPNMATCLKEAGYDVIYKGKWHLSKGVQGADPGVTIPDDISRYGFDGWDPPDAGMNTDPTQFGGGFADNDGGISTTRSHSSRACRQALPRPFCLIVSLVNPHDVLAYPKPDKFLGGGYTPDWLTPTDPPIALPPTVGRTFENNKPLAQEQYKLASAGLGILASDDKKLNYLNFYGNLMNLVDSQLGELLAVFDQGGAAGQQLLRDTIIIRTSDHGEMAMCHGGLRRSRSSCMGGHAGAADLVQSRALWWTRIHAGPGVARGPAAHSVPSSGFPDWRAKGFRGVDYSNILLNPRPRSRTTCCSPLTTSTPARDESQFPDGVASHQPHPDDPHGGLQVCEVLRGSLRGDQEEFYDLRPQGGDYDSLRAAAGDEESPVGGDPSGIRRPHARAGGRPHQTDARPGLAAAGACSRVPSKHRPAPGPPVGGGEPSKTRRAGGGGGHTFVQVTFLSRSNEIYFLDDLVTWENVPGGAPRIPSCHPVSAARGGQQRSGRPVHPALDGKAYYRLIWAAKPAGPPLVSRPLPRDGQTIRGAVQSRLPLTASTSTRNRCTPREAGVG